jgi:hypothetical protein
MNTHIHTLFVAPRIESRVQDAVDERLARELRHPRRDAGRFMPKRRRRNVRVTARA